ncbi:MULTISPECIES: AAA family ATPase [Emticicia]|uniref:AAA family ATPase n=1 Tax=Emticicia TaxID=312278 RepID=UPI0007D89F0E|nr:MULTISPECIES: AAA family ATPase [Emticicia]
MKIQKLQLKNFKRFTDLTIEGIPENTKLVLLIGANGSGKSSVFDAFEVLNTITKGELVDKNTLYYKKNNSISSTLYILKNDGDIDVNLFHPDNSVNFGWSGKSNFYGRTSFRQISRLTKTVLGSDLSTQNDADRPKTYIDRDERFENDIENMLRDILKNVFSSIDSSKYLREKYVYPINQALHRIFDNDHNIEIELLEIIPPLEGKTAEINFKKGNSEIHYNLLSAGEKEVVNILFNLLSRKDLLQDAILFFDEMDLHLNTAIQYNLLKEITENWIPDNSQLWTASHSLGFIDYARKSNNAAIIDFDSLNFDVAQTLLPQSKEMLDVYDIAVPKSMLSQLFKGQKIIFCENKNDEWYNLLGIDKTIFVGGKDSRDVFLHIKKDKNNHALRDRDFLSDSEVLAIKKDFPNYHILKYYDFENYLYHPENIAEFSPEGFDKQTYIEEIIRQKNIKIFNILTTVASSRQTYEEFKTNEKLKDKEVDAIVEDFRSDDFERFYKFFDMKVQFNKSYLTKFNLSKEKLVSTKWFKAKIQEIIK